MGFGSTFCIVLATFASFSFCFPSKQQIPLQDKKRSPFTPDFDEDVGHLLNHWHVPGLSVAIVDGNETFTKGYGVSSFPSVNVNPSTLFYTGSTTKAFTAAALALLIDETVNSSSPLTWHTPISSLIREDFVLPDEYATLHTTLEDAASHRTGMPGHDSSYGGPNFGLRDVVRNLRNLPMTAEIRTRYQYCNMIYMTLSHVIETLTGFWLGDILWSRIWSPLNMTRTYFSFSQAQQAVDRDAAELAKGYMWNNKTQKYVQTPWMDIPLVSGAGNIISNVEDYSQWLRFLINQSPPLSKTGHMSLRHPRTILEDNPLPGFTSTSAYALGWNIETYRGEPLISHTGGLPGFGAIIGYLPRRRYGITMMGNTAETSNIVELILFYRLLDDYLNIKEEDRGDVVAVFENLILNPKKEQLAHPIKALYPNTPTGKNAIPLSLPLEKYTGVYHNKGYRNITITLSHQNDSSSPSPSTAPRQPKLLSSPPPPHLHSHINRTFASTLSFSHVSGEFFLIKGHLDLSEGEVDTENPLSNMLYKAEFRLGEDGEVAEVGVNLEPQMGEGKKIWFMRVADVE
ncbi:MAG: hypothetical protein Q9225_000458 [Loekoesia sp. 1 TL-2023]